MPTNTSKGACITFSQALAAKWGPQGIRVNAVAPGPIRTKMAEGMFAAIGADKLAAKAPLRRTGDDEDFKGIARRFASAAGKHITGRVMAVGGGTSAVIPARHPPSKGHPP